MVGLIYELYSTENPYRFYVGSTEMTLKDRLRYHKMNAKYRSELLVYKRLFQYDKSTWQIVLVEECDKTGADLRKLEEFWRVTLRAPLNQNRAYRTQAEKAAADRGYKEKNPEAARMAWKKYRENNREGRRESGRKHYRKQKIWPFFRAAQARAAFQLKIST